MAYDSNRGVMVLFGGKSSVLLEDTWEWDGVTWTQRFPATHPSARYEHGLAYDSVRHVSVLFGGQGSLSKIYPWGQQNDTWEWDGTNWTPRLPVSSPLPRAEGALAYDSNRGVCVLWGGWRNDTQGIGGGFTDIWEWDGANWTQRADNVPASDFDGICYDTVRHVTLMVDGDYGAHTLAWDGQSVTFVAPPPHERWYPGFCFDSTRGVAMRFGGYFPEKPAYLGDTSEFNGSAWTSLSVSGPQARYGPSMAYDVLRRRTVLFGGRLEGSGNYAGDTWEYIAPGIAGDMNDDAATNTNDVSNFVEALIDPAAFEAGHSTVPLLRGDMNCDGSLDGNDIAGFVSKLLSP